VLKRMKRRHLRADAIRVVERARALRPDVAFGADVIAGFPTESDAMFENTAALLVELGIQHLHVFPYSPRPGTPAARMPQVPGDVRKARAARLREIGAANLAAWLASLTGRPDRVLIEADGAGRGESFAPIALEPGAAAEAGTVVPVTLLGLENGRLIGRPDLRVAA